MFLSFLNVGMQTISDVWVYHTRILLMDRELIYPIIPSQLLANDGDGVSIEFFSVVAYCIS